MAEEIQDKDIQQPQPETPSSNKRLAMNTFALYVRMVVMTIIGLYTSRIVLQVLGVNDFGVYNVVGGIVVMLQILSGSLSTAVSRFLTFELGHGNREKLKEIFSTSVNVQLALAVAVLLIGGIVGWCLVNFTMDIPDGRMLAANWVLFASLISFCINLVSIPYTASVISHERMTAFAVIEVLRSLLRLGAVSILFLFPKNADKLIFYAILLMVVEILIRIVYGFYCKREFDECHYRFVYDKELLKKMSGFAGWTFLGNAAWMLNTQGINFLMNIFFGVTLNAARGIAVQVETVVQQFVNNFMMALNPQITKTYASDELPRMHQLICTGARISFFLMVLISLPICFETKFLLSLWLGAEKVNEMSFVVIFTRLSFVSALCTVLGSTLVTAQLATGKVRTYQIVMTVIGIWVFPFTWLAYKLGGTPEWGYIIFIIIYFILIFVRVYLVKDLIKMSWKMYVCDVIVRCLAVGVICALLPLVIYLLMTPSLLRFVVVTIVSLTYSGMVIYWIGLRHDERTRVKELINKKFLHRQCQY